MTWANVLTCIRITFSLVLCYTLALHAWGYALCCFMLSAVTDVADGVCARWLHQESAIGRSLDPVADKILLFGCYLTLAYYVAPPVIPFWFFSLVCIKELCMLGGVIIVVWSQRHHLLVPIAIGKATMVMHILLIAWILVSRWYQRSIYELPVLLWSVALLTIITAVQYMYRFLTQKGAE